MSRPMRDISPETYLVNPHTFSRLEQSPRKGSRRFSHGALGSVLGADSSDRDDMIGVDDEVFPGLGLDEPRKLHD